MGLQCHKNVLWTFFAGKHQVLLASDEPTGNKSERYSSLTAAQLVIAKKRSLRIVWLMRRKFFLRCTKPLHKEKTCKQEPARRKLKENLQARPNPP